VRVSPSSLCYSKSRRTKKLFSNVCICPLSTSIQANRPNSRIVGLKLKSRDNKGELISLSQHHDAVVHPTEHTVAILALVDREMARIKERDHRHFKWIPPAEPTRLLSPPPPSSLSPTLGGYLSSPECRVVRVRRGHRCVPHDVERQISQQSLRRAILSTLDKRHEYGIGAATCGL
jgi:hypothetical protein